MISFRLSFRPKLLDAMKNYRLEDFGSDLSAGITVGFVALPLAMAFAIASGLKPEAGIYTAIVAGFIISTSRWIEGPDRRSCGRLHRNRLRHCHYLWRKRLDDLDHSCRCSAFRHGHLEAGNADTFRAGPDRHGFHERYRGSDRAFASERPTWPQDRRSSVRFFSARYEPCGASSAHSACPQSS